MNLENKGSIPIRIIQVNHVIRRGTRLSFPKYKGNFEPPRENSAAARKRKGALPFEKRRAASVVSRRERVENAPGKFSHLSAIPIPANIKRALGATKPNTAHRSRKYPSQFEQPSACRPTPLGSGVGNHLKPRPFSAVSAN